MSDHLSECNSGDLRIDPKTFTTTWCDRCSQRGCDLAGYANNDPMAIRNATWQDRFFNAEQADLGIPKFAQIAKLDFPNLIQKAMRLEISARRGDWSVPEIAITDGRIIQTDQDTALQVEEAVRALSHRLDPAQELAPAPEEVGSSEAPDRPEPLSNPPPPPVSDTPATAGDSEEPTDAPPPSRNAQQARPVGRNTPDRGEVMIGGAPMASGRAHPTPEVDPWAPAPKAKHRVVKPGATVRFGAGGTAEVLDD